MKSLLLFFFVCFKGLILEDLNIFSTCLDMAAVSFDYRLVKLMDASLNISA